MGTICHILRVMDGQGPRLEIVSPEDRVPTSTNSPKPSNQQETCNHYTSGKDGSVMQRVKIFFDFIKSKVT
jgi:hypothetical protein